jgi:polysaccharide biosynthesis protein VpsQ
MIRIQRQIKMILAFLFMIFFLYIIYLANKGALPYFIRKLYMFPGGDKLGHIVLLGILSFFVNQLLYPKCFHIFGISILMGSFIVACFITIEEASQILMSNRVFDLIDLLCSFIGILMGDLVVKYIKRKKI